MKKIFILVLLLLSNVAVTFASSLINTQEDLIYKNFVSTIVPEDYVEPFYENTKNNITIGIELLAIGQKETEWKMKEDGTWPICRNRDKNGNVVSTDHGPLQLNSKNFVSFEKMFGEGLEDYKSNIDIYRMCLCIKYYQDIRRDSGTYNAFREYNGGYYYYKKPITAEYANKTSEYNNKFSREYKIYKRNELVRIQQEAIDKLVAEAKDLKTVVAMRREINDKRLSSVPLRKYDTLFYVKKEELFYWYKVA